MVGASGCWGQTTLLDILKTFISWITKRPWLRTSTRYKFQNVSKLEYIYPRNIPCTIYRWRSVWSDTRIKQYWPKIFNKIIYVTKRNMWDNWWNRCFQKHKKSISNSIIFLHLALRILKTWPIEGIKTIAKKTKGNGKIIKIPRGGRRRSVDLSAPTILQPWVRIPSSASLCLLIQN